jgi:hypothetical protein
VDRNSFGKCAKRQGKAPSVEGRRSVGVVAADVGETRSSHADQAGIEVE